MHGDSGTSAQVPQHGQPFPADQLVGRHSQTCLKPRIAGDAVGGSPTEFNIRKLGNVEDKGNGTAHTGTARFDPCLRVIQRRRAATDDQRAKTYKIHERHEMKKMGMAMMVVMMTMMR